MGSSGAWAISTHDRGETDRVDVRIAGREDLAHLARLLWSHAAPQERARQPIESFTVDLAAWWSEHDETHFAFVAPLAGSQIAGMAWLAVVPRVPRPGLTSRRSADIQSVFVVPEHRGNRIGSALVRVAWQHALRLGADRVTVHSGRRALPMYERLGFAPSAHLLQRIDRRFDPGSTASP
jgi:GNAT superfamily N-acetyltransferase